MAFKEAFTEVKDSRRMSRGEFGVNPTYIHDVQKGKILPSREKLDVITGHAEAIAVEQGAESGESDRRKLEGAWFEDQLARLGVKSEHASTLGKLLALGEEEREAAFQIIDHATERGASSPSGQQDPYSEVAILGERNFELRGSGLVVPLEFKPDAAVVVSHFLEQESPFTRNDIVTLPAFNEACGSAWPHSRLPLLFSDLQFTFSALGSTLMQTDGRQGRADLYVRNPDYQVTDERA